MDILPTSVKNFFEEAVKKLDEDRKIIAPKILGIDEAHLNETMRGVFTDTGNNKLLEISKDNLKRTVKEVIKSMEGYENIEVVTIDMYSGYKHACRELIPNALVVVDKFHVIQYVIRALDEFEESMKEVFTTCVGQSTLDEAPQAYKPIKDILDNIGDTVEITDILKPVYNFKNN